MMSENNLDHAQSLAALQWYVDHGVDQLFMDAPVDRTAMPAIPKPSGTVLATGEGQQPAAKAPTKVIQFQDTAPQEDMMGAAEAIVEAQKLAASCATLEDLAQAIKDFNGLSVKKTASNMVFADGNPKADVMIIGEAPAADEDIQGKPFVGQSGQLQDKILACINLDRKSEEPQNSVYMTNVLNWRPPGNRTPTDAEIEVSLAFIERHIALIQPKAIIFLGGVPAKALLRSKESISKLRGKFHEYQIADGAQIPTMVTYHPTYLLKTPAQKKAVWADMLMFQDKIATF